MKTIKRAALKNVLSAITSFYKYVSQFKPTDILNFK